jgi:hypothetical protein
MIMTLPSSPATARCSLRIQLERSIFTSRFSRAQCEDREHGFLIVFFPARAAAWPPIKPSHLAEMAAQLAVHVFPRPSVCQWVLSVHKCLYYFLQRGAAFQAKHRLTAS